MFQALLGSLGGRWTLRVYAVFNLVAGLPIAWAVPRSRFAAVSTAERPERRSTHVSRALASRWTFLFSALAAFLQVGAQEYLALFVGRTDASSESKQLARELDASTLEHSSLHSFSRPF